MGLQAIEAGPKYGSPVFLVDQDTGDMTAAPWAVRHGVSFQREGASIALPPAHWLRESKTAESSRGKSRVVARTSVAVAVCVLWLFIGAVGDNALCGESDTRAQAFVATENGHKIAQANAMRGESLLVSQVVETTVIEQKQILERGREKVDILAGRLTPIRQLDAAQGKAPQRAPAREQMQALDQERDRADALARELTSLWAELDAARSAGSEAVQAREAEIKQKQELEQERGWADTLARELTSLRAELDAARNGGPEIAQAAAAVEQKQALEQERDRGEVLARELTSLRAELDTTRAAGLEAARTAEAAKIEQDLALRKEGEKTETLARE